MARRYIAVGESGFDIVTNVRDELTELAMNLEASVVCEVAILYFVSPTGVLFDRRGVEESGIVRWTVESGFFALPTDIGAWTLQIKLTASGYIAWLPKAYFDVRAT